jgi:hypothetical protein
MQTNLAKATIIYPDDIYQELMWYVNMSKFEVSGFCLAKYDKKANTFTATHLRLLKQENHSSETEMCPTAFGKLLSDINDIEYDVLIWWHSHVMMGVFWSPTDKETIKMLSEHGPIVCTVFNQKNEYKSCIRMPVTVKIPILGEYTTHEFHDDTATKFTRALDTSLSKKWTANYKAQVTEPTQTIMTPIGKREPMRSSVRFATSFTYNNRCYQRGTYNGADGWWFKTEFYSSKNSLKKAINRHNRKLEQERKIDNEITDDEQAEVERLQRVRDYYWSQRPDESSKEYEERIALLCGGMA